MLFYGKFIAFLMFKLCSSILPETVYRVLRPLVSYKAVDMPVDLCIDIQDVVSQLIN